MMLTWFHVKDSSAWKWVCWSGSWHMLLHHIWYMVWTNPEWIWIYSGFYGGEKHRICPVQGVNICLTNLHFGHRSFEVWDIPNPHCGLHFWHQNSKWFWQFIDEFKIKSWCKSEEMDMLNMPWNMSLCDKRRLWEEMHAETSTYFPVASDMI